MKRKTGQTPGGDVSIVTYLICPMLASLLLLGAYFTVYRQGLRLFLQIPLLQI